MEAISTNYRRLLHPPHFITNNPKPTNKRINNFTMVLLKGWKYAAMVSSVIGVIGLAIYPIIVSPMVNPEPYRKQQAINRSGVKQEEVQPGNMKVWSDPFSRPKEAVEK